ncbi:MAG: hypothetical protein Q7S02_04520 [bacterium]|nr:hypothetical protein [bacterium]
MRFSQLSRTVVTFRGPLLAHPFVRWCAVASMTFLAGAWIAILAIPNSTADESIIVHYTTTFGIDALGSWTDLMRLPLTGTVLLVVNCGLARFLARQDHVDAPIVLMVASVVLEFAVLIGALLLLRMNNGL